MSGVFKRLPREYRVEDARQGDPLSKYLSLTGDQLDEIRALVRRIYPESGPSALADPALADASWLRWMAQFVGIPRVERLLDAQLRTAIADASTGWRSGTMPGLLSMIASLLTPDPGETPHVRIDRDLTEPWHLTIRTSLLATPQGGDALIAQVTESGAKAAGILLTWLAYAPSWDMIETTFTSWEALDLAKTWIRIESAHPIY